MSEDHINTLIGMADSLSMAAEAEGVIVDHYSPLMLNAKVAKLDPMDARRYRVYAEALSNRRRFEREAAAIRFALTKIAEG